MTVVIKPYPAFSTAEIVSRMLSSVKHASVSYDATGLAYCNVAKRREHSGDLHHCVNLVLQLVLLRGTKEAGSLGRQLFSLNIQTDSWQANDSS